MRASTKRVDPGDLTDKQMPADNERKPVQVTSVALIFEDRRVVLSKFGAEVLQRSIIFAHEASNAGVHTSARSAVDSA